MTATAFIADVHVGNHGPVQPSYSLVSPVKSPLVNLRAREVLGVLKASVGVAQHHRACELVICGDLFDVPAPTAPFYLAVREALATFQGRIYLIAGNHEIASAHESDSPAAVLSKMLPDVRFIPPKASKLTPNGVLCVGFPAGEDQAAAISVLRDHVRNHPSARVLATHLGVITDTTPPWGRQSAEALPVRAFQSLGGNLQGVVLGNWHDAETVEGHPWIEQVGALCPTGFDNASAPHLYAQVLVLDEEGSRGRHFVPAPRFLRYDVPEGAPVPNFAEQLAPVLARKAAGYNFVTTLYLRFRCFPGDVPRVREEVAAQLPSIEREVRGVVVLCDPTATREVSTEAPIVTAVAADEHLFEYVLQVDVPTNVPRKRLMKTLKEMVKRE